MSPQHGREGSEFPRRASDALVPLDSEGSVRPAAGDGEGTNTYLPLKPCSAPGLPLPFARKVFNACI